MKDIIRRVLPDSAKDRISRAKRSAQWAIHKRQVLKRLAVEDPSDVSRLEGALLFFSPEAGLEPHYVAQCVVAKTLLELGHRPVFVRCFRVYTRCPVMDVRGLPYDMSENVRTETCLHCASDAMRMLDAYSLEHFDLRQVVSEQLKSQAKALLADAPDDLRQFRYQDIDFGKLSAMDLVLATKTSDFENVSPVNRAKWLQYIEGSLLSYLVVQTICRAAKIKGLVHFNDYSLLLGARLAATREGVPCTGVTQASHKNIDRQRFLFLPDVFGATARDNRAAWPLWRELPLTPAQVRTCGEDFLVRVGGKGSHIFSPAKTFQNGDIRVRLGLDTDKKLLVAYTSSLDERIASRMTMEGVGWNAVEPPQPFEDQIEWLQALVAHTAAREDLQLVVRVHPREGTGTRGGNSQHLGRLEEAFGTLPANCKFIWPAEAISSYDLAEAADVTLVSWSTIGIELARLGIPTLASTNGINAFPHEDFIEWGQTPELYFEVLDELLQRPPALGTIGRAYRWYHLHHLGSSLNLDDVVPASAFEAQPVFKLPAEARTIESVIVDGKRTLDLNYERQQVSITEKSAEMERQALKHELKRVIHFFYTGETGLEDVALQLVHSTESADEFLSNLPSEKRGSTFLLANGAHTAYIHGGRTFIRYSPLCARLASLCATGEVSASESQVPAA